MDPSPYWDDYYSARPLLRSVLPSQFAAFVAGELGTSAEAVLDVGCGDGRDSLFLAGLGYRVVGLDASAEAVALCERRRRTVAAEIAERSTFVRAGVGEAALESATGLLESSHRIAVYARFFLHAIDEAGEDALLQYAAGLGDRLAVLAVEFRTRRDALQPKVTPDHYRRFISPPTVLERASSHGLSAEYFVEGFGYAKHGPDDAHVARILLTRP